MIYSHYSSQCNSIMRSKRLYLSRLSNCKGQEDFCLTLNDYINMIEQIDLNKIKFNDFFSKEKFTKVLNIKNLNNNYNLKEDSIFGVCLTENPVSKEFNLKYGYEYINIELDNIKKYSFLNIRNVIYSLNNIEQYFYDLTSDLYVNGEYQTRLALELTEEQMPDNYDDIFTRSYYYLKVLYKKEKYKFENEIRVFFDETKIKSSKLEEFNGSNYHYTHNLNYDEFNKCISKIDDNHYALNLDFLGIMLDLEV